jgi:hypothetical protein
MPRTSTIAGALCVVTLAACGGNGGPSSASPSTTRAGLRSTTTAAPGANPSCEQADPAALEPLVAVDVPAGFVQQTDDVGDTGPSDLDKAVRDDGDPNARAELIDVGFRRGYQRLWVNDQHDELIVFLYEYCDGAGAKKYRDGNLDAFEGEGLSRFDTSTFADAVGFSGADNEASAAIVSAVSGRYGVQVVVNGAPDDALTGLQNLATVTTTKVIAGLPTPD